MAKLIDLTGSVFGKWSVVSSAGKLYDGRRLWNCVCECGLAKVVIGSTLRSGTSKSCGCAGKDWCRTHGMEGTRIYSIWAGMIQRCTNTKYRDYAMYGGRGIKVCERWRNSFAEFYADMGDRPEGKSLDRKENDGDYCKENCRWATKKQQIRNRRTTAMLTFNEETLPLPEWAERFGIKRKILERRIRDGWQIEKALSVCKYGRWGTI